MPHCIQRVFAFPDLFIPNDIVFNPIIQQVEINFQNLFHWGGAAFVRAYINPNDII